MSYLNAFGNGLFRTKHFVTILVLLAHLKVNAQVAVNTGDFFPNSTVQAIVEDENYIYVGGQFTELSDGTNISSLSYLVRYSKEGYTLDESWDLQLDNHVYALEVDGDYLYIGGQFTTILGSARNNLAKINKSGDSPTLESWDPSPDAPVRALELGNNSIYVGGNYANISSTARNCLTKFDTSTGNLDGGFSPSVTTYIPYNNTTVPGKILTMIYDESVDSLYIGGAFDHVGATGVNELAKLNGSNGAVSPDWFPEPNNEVSDMELVGDSLFIGGRFTSAGGQSRRSIAKIHASGSGAADASWNPDPPRNNFVFALSMYDGDLYAGGGFNSIGGESIVRIAKLSTSGTGAADASWSVSNGGSINYMITSGDYLYIGGNFSSLDDDSTIQRFGVINVGPKEINVLGNDNSIVSGDDSPNETDGTDFGSSLIGSSSTQTFTIENEGSKPLEITDIQISGTDATDFSISNITLPVSLSGISSTTFDVTYNPSSAGTSAATIQISSDDEDEGTYTFAIAGLAQTPQEINVQGDGVDIASGDDTPSSTDGTDFGTITIGSPSASTFTIQNIGDVTLNVSSIEISGADASDFSVTNITTPANVSGSSSVTFDVVFDPSDAGTSEALVTIESDDSDEGTYTFVISGIGEEALGLSELENIKVFPNPTAEYFSFESASLSTKDELILIDAQGKEAIRYNISTGNRYNISGLAGGIYVLVIETDDVRRKAGRLVIKN
ncbi:MAG: choice-of-anchor D domain-containing protein [Ekhidna sp.]|uniref:choice-of-anchor D domain-containing protein n=1 Tax=Ekhidna sp. TaxID=2608089 RepID=UPI0032EE305F